jgi:hypothetical protein
LTIAEDDTPDFNEQIYINEDAKKFYLDLEDIQANLGKKDFKDIMIYFLQGWQWNEGIEDSYRRKLKSQIQDGFFVRHNGKVITEDVFKKITDRVQQNWFLKQNDPSSDFEILKAKKEDTKMYIRFLDAFIGEPKQKEAERSVYEVQKLYIAAQLFGITDLTNHLLWRYGKILTGHT